MFELTLAKNQLLTPLLIVSGVVDRKQVTPILSHILITMVDNEIQLIATDLEIEITARITYSINKLQDKVTIPAKKFVDIIRSLEEATITTITASAKSVIITAGRSQFKLSTLPAADFPISKHANSDIELTLPRKALLYLLQSTYFAMAAHDVRIFLNTLLIELEPQTMRAVATDGHRMAICSLTSLSINDYHRFLLPKKSVHEMIKLLHHITDEELIISAGIGHFKLTTKEYIFQSKLIDTRFPAYEKVIPKQQDKSITIDCDLLKRSLSRMMILSNEKSRAIIIVMQPNSIILSTHNQEHEEATEELEAKIVGSPIKISMNANYVLDVLNILNDGLINISISNADSSILIETSKDKQYKYVIMPIKL